MSDAKQCDRCEEFYIPKPSPEYKLHKDVHFDGMLSPQFKIRDLCPVCYAELKDWYEDGPDRLTDGEQVE